MHGTTTQATLNAHRFLIDPKERIRAPEHLTQSGTRHRELVQGSMVDEG